MNYPPITETEARRYLEALRWPEFRACPFCKTQHDAKMTRRAGRYRCAGCRRDFSVTTATIFHGLRISPLALVRVFYAAARCKRAKYGSARMRSLGAVKNGDRIARLVDIAFEAADVERLTAVHHEERRIVASLAKRQKDRAFSWAEKSVARQALRNKRIARNNIGLPFDEATPLPVHMHNAAIAAATRATCKIDKDIRADVQSDIVTALLSGWLDMEEVDKALPTFVRRAYSGSLFGKLGQTVSIYSPIGNDKILLDVLTHDEEAC